MSNADTTPSPLAPLAYFLVAAGGGVIGHDYARWLTVDPFVGAIAGGLVSIVIVRILFQLYADPEHKIRNALSAIGGMAGIVVGGNAGSAESSNITAWLIALRSAARSALRWDVRSRPPYRCWRWSCCC